MCLRVTNHRTKLSVFLVSKCKQLTSAMVGLQRAYVMYVFERHKSLNETFCFPGFKMQTTDVSNGRSTKGLCDVCV